MTDWQTRLAPWIGSAVQVVMTDGQTIYGILGEPIGQGICVDWGGGSTTSWHVVFADIREVWVQLALEEEGKE